MEGKDPYRYIDILSVRGRDLRENKGEDGPDVLYCSSTVT
jgi:hypothetical protein